MDAVGAPEAGWLAVFVLGFTGSRVGPTEAQVHMMRRCLVRLRHRHGEDLRVLHGDCVGADAAFDRCAADLGV